MKNAFAITLLLLIPLFTGCKAWQKFCQAAFQQEIIKGSTTINHTNVIDQLETLPDGTTGTNKLVEITQETVPTWTTNYVVKPVIESGVKLAGDVAPFPWAGLASNGVLSVLGGLAALYGRKYKKAAVSAIHAADQFRVILKEKFPAADEKVVKQLKKDQQAAGTKTTIDKLIRNTLK